MLNNKHIIKTLSNTIYFFLVFGLFLSNINIWSMDPAKIKITNEIDEIDETIPGPDRPPFD